MNNYTPIDLDRKQNENSSKILQFGKVIWLFGLSGAGKSTIANRLEQILNSSENKPVYRLDGDILRLGLNSDLGFSESDRLENIRRTAEVAKLFADAGFIVIASLITPLRSMRALAREIIGEERFIGVYIRANLETCEKRDPKGLHQRARNGEIKSFTGIDSLFEEANDSDLMIDTENMDLESSVEIVLAAMK